jgi:hypothetical protein
MYQREAVQVRDLLVHMERADPPFSEARSRMLFDRLMARMASQDQARRRAWRLARVLGGAALVGAGVLQLLGL